MEQYKISQNPGSPKKAAPKGKKKTVKRGAAPKHRDTKSLSPQLIMVAIVFVLVLVFGGVVWAHYFSKPAITLTPTNGTKAGTSANRGGTTKAVPSATLSGIADAIANKKTGDLKVYYAKKVKVIIVKNSVNKTVNSGDVDGLVANPLNSAQTPWDWHVPPSDISAWQQGPYGQYFDGNILVGESNDGTVIIIHFDDNGQIDSIVIVPAGDLTGPAADGTGHGTGQEGNPDSGSTPDTTPVVTPTGGVNATD